MRLKENSETKADVFYSYRDGYIYIKNKWHDNDVIEISFNMDIRVIYANTKVREDIGCAALQRGPVVYAFEGVDNDDDVQSLMIDVSRLNEAQIETEAEGILKGAVLLDIPAVRLEGSDALYSEKPPRQKSVIARAIPYFRFQQQAQLICRMNTHLQASLSYAVRMQSHILPFPRWCFPSIQMIRQYSTLFPHLSWNF